MYCDLQGLNIIFIENGLKPPGKCLRGQWQHNTTLGVLMPLSKLMEIPVISNTALSSWSKYFFTILCMQ
jgi:hypothetical protein